MFSHVQRWDRARQMPHGTNGGAEGAGFLKRQRIASNKLIDATVWFINIAVVCGKQRIVCPRSKISTVCRVEYDMNRQTSQPAYFHVDLRGK